MSFTHFVKTYELQNDKVLLPKKQLVTYALYALIAVALLYLFFFEPAPPAVAAQKQELPPSFPLPYQRDETLMRSASRQGNKTVQ
jgi:xyloglucan O-acetyltransferase